MSLLIVENEIIKRTLYAGTRICAGDPKAGEDEERMFVMPKRPTAGDGNRPVVVPST
jgi:hypothetical protein